MRCDDCDRVYVAESGRSFDVRLGEHKDAVRLGRGNNAVYKHVYDTNHSINWNGSKLLYHSRDLNNRLIVESALIKSVDNFNVMPGTCAVDGSTKNIILQSNPAIMRAFRT